MSCHLARNILECSICIEHCFPGGLIGSRNQLREVISWVDQLKGFKACIESSLKDGVCEIEEYFEKDHQMSVVE